MSEVDPQPRNLAAGRPAWLTAKRLRAHSVIVGVCLWSLYIWNLSTPGLLDRGGNVKGTDFLHFYTLGALAGAHRGEDLYDMKSSSALLAEQIPKAAGKRYLPLYPPQVSIFFAPFAGLSYENALIVWWCCSALLYGLCCYAIWRACPNLRAYGTTVALAAAAFPAFFHLIAWGQTSALALGCFAVAFLGLRSKREILAGAALGALIFKPQLGIAAAVVFFSIGAWKIVGAAILSAAAQLLLGVVYYGWAPLRNWASAILAVPAEWTLLEPRPYQTHTLRTFWAMLVPWSSLASTLYIASALVVLGLAVVLWRRRDSAPLALRFSTLLLATVLVSPHLTVYDLVIVAPAFLLAADWAAGRPGDSQAGRLSLLLYLIYVLPLLGPAVQWIHVQLSVVAMAATVFVIWRTAQDFLP